MIEGFMKRDGRKISRKALEEMCLMAYERMAEGEPPAEVSASFGFHRSRAYKVRAKARAGAGPTAVACALGRRSPAQADRGAGTPSVSLGQWAQPPAVWF